MDVVEVPEPVRNNVQRGLISWFQFIVATSIRYVIPAIFPNINIDQFENNRTQILNDCIPTPNDVHEYFNNKYPNANIGQPQRVAGIWRLAHVVYSMWIGLRVLKDTVDVYDVSAEDLQMQYNAFVYMLRGMDVSFLGFTGALLLYIDTNPQEDEDVSRTQEMLCIDIHTKYATVTVNIPELIGEIKNAAAEANVVIVTDMWFETRLNDILNPVNVNDMDIDNDQEVPEFEDDSEDESDIEQSDSENTDYDDDEMDIW